jgi:O-antigen ligase
LYFPVRRLPIIDIYVGPSEPTLATSGSFFNPSIFALYGLMALIFSISLLLDELDGAADRSGSVLAQPRILGILAALLGSVVLLVWTQTRSAWFALMLVLFTFSRLQLRRPFLALGRGMLLLTLLALYNALSPTPVMPYVLPRSLAAKLTVFSGDRARYYQLAWRLIQERPWTGWGIGTFPRLIPAWLLGYQVLHTHSLPLQLAQEVGVPAAVAVLALMGSLALVTARGIIRREQATGIAQPLDRGLLVTFVVILLMQVLDVALLMTYRLQFLFWLCLAAPYSRVACRSIPNDG